MSKPRYRWIESHGAWLLRYERVFINCPLWLFPAADAGRDW